MKICITAVHDRLSVISIVNHTNKCGLVEAKNRVDNINITPLILDIPQSDLTRLQKYCTFKIIENNMQNQFEFKPFDQVLVRDYDDDPWRAMHYSHFDSTQQRHYCSSSYWNRCIPYNENTAHLLGTCTPYKEPEPKTYQVIFITQNGDRHQVSYTDNEFKKFIETTINNKDVSNFDVRRICD